MGRTKFKSKADAYEAGLPTGCQLNECWPWQRKISPEGYGRFNYRGDRYYAHREAYTRSYGSIPAGLTIDHLCHNRAKTCAGNSTCLHRRCVNPAHLEAVSHRTNIIRGNSPSMEFYRKGTCQRGHPKTPENMYIRKDRPGKWECRPCARAREKAKRQP